MKAMKYCKRNAIKLMIIIIIIYALQNLSVNFQTMVLQYVYIDYSIGHRYVVL